MPRRGRPLRPLELSEDERAQLGRWTRRRHTAAGLAQRARMVLLAAEGLSNREVAARLGCSDATVGKWRARFLSDATVGKWRARFLEHRLAGLVDEPRSGRPRSVTDEMVQDVVIKTLESTAPDATHWSTRSMAKATELSQTKISQIWRAFELKPHLSETFKLSTDPPSSTRCTTSWRCT